MGSIMAEREFGTTMHADTPNNTGIIHGIWLIHNESQKSSYVVALRRVREDEEGAQPTYPIPPSRHPKAEGMPAVPHHRG
jgi:hypothetical protein